MNAIIIIIIVTTTYIQFNICIIFSISDVNLTISSLQSLSILSVSSVIRDSIIAAIYNIVLILNHNNRGFSTASYGDNLNCLVLVY